jgi:hypothetical protein
MVQTLSMKSSYFYIIFFEQPWMTKYVDLKVLYNFAVNKFFYFK